MRKIFYILLMLVFPMVAWGQTMVYLEHSETLSFDERLHPDAQILRGDVCFRHDDALMYCDSAYFYEKTNSLDAFGHVRMLQGDTLSGYGDVLYYNGNTKMARMRRHVRLVHAGGMTLTTDSLNYDRSRDLAYYFTGGTLQDSLNVLVSRWGQYAPSTKQAVFRGKVKLTNPNFVLTADTLKYNTETKITNLVGPTTIVYEEETTILSTRGWYNTETERSLLLDRSRIIHVDGKSMIGDSIYYDKQAGYGRLIGNMQLTDSLQRATLYGNYGEAYERQDSVGSHGFATDSALLVDWSDSLHYMYTHADTLFSEQILYTMLTPDSVEVDTSFAQVRAYYGVRVFREDVQAVCDSMVYNDRDSVMTLYKMPVCWSDSNQLSADVIHVYMKDEVVDYMHGIGNALTVKQANSTYFDQMAGKEIQGYVRDGELKQIDVSGNAETVFYPKDDADGSYAGMNVTQSSYVKLFLEEQKIHHILFTAETTGTMYPLDQIPDGKDRLSGFFWAEKERPLRPGDVFLRIPRTEKPGQAVVSAVEEPKENEKENKEAEKPKRMNRKSTR